MAHGIAGLAVVVVLAGCRPVQAAPEDVDGLLHWFWQNQEAAPDDEALDAIDNLAQALEAQGFDGELRGSMSDLGVDELPELEGAPDPETASGFFLMYGFPCTLEALEPLLYALDQDVLYPGAYDSYDRRYRTPLAAYQSREAPALRWDIDLVATTAGSTFSERLVGGVRYVAPEAGRGPALLVRTWMPEPAVFEDGNKRFEQDYQVEVFWEREPGQVWHLYGMWREMFLGAGLSTDDDVVVNVILNNLRTWDDHTAELCEARAR